MIIFSASLFFSSLLPRFRGFPPSPPTLFSACPPVGGNRRIWTKFDTPSFLAILRDPAGDPQSSWSIGRRLAGAKQYRLFTNTSWPAGVSKRLGLEAACLRALPIFVFSNKCIESFSVQCQSDKASSFLCSRKAMKCAKPVESNICHLREGLPFW